MTDPSVPHDVTELIDAFVDGRDDPLRAQRLEEALLQDPEARRSYCEHMALLTQLDSSGGVFADFNGDVADAAAPVPVSEEVPTDAARQPAIQPARRSAWFSKHIPRNSIIITAVLFLAVGIILGRLYLTDDTNDGARDTAEKPTSTKHVAILNHERGVKWVEGERTKAWDPRLWPGEKLVIDEGLIEIKYKTGARVVIEGPAEYYVGAKDEGGRIKEATEPAEARLAADRSGRKEAGRGSDVTEKGEGGSLQPSENSGYLAYGRLVARCETKASKGFTIDTPLTRVEDLGTEFAVAVAPGGTTDLLVYEGKVKLGGTRGLPAQIVGIGDSRRVAAGSSGDDVEIAAASMDQPFVRSFATDSSAEADYPYAVRPSWDTYVFAQQEDRSYRSSTLQVKHDLQNPEYQREAWLAFDLSQVDLDSLADAQLALTLTDVVARPTVTKDVAQWKFELYGMVQRDLGIDDPAEVSWSSTRNKNAEQLAALDLPSTTRKGRRFGLGGNQLTEFLKQSAGQTVVLVVKRATVSEHGNPVHVFASSEQGHDGPALRLRYSRRGLADKVEDEADGMNLQRVEKHANPSK